MRPTLVSSSGRTAAARLCAACRSSLSQTGASRAVVPSSAAAAVPTRRAFRSLVQQQQQQRALTPRSRLAASHQPARFSSTDSSSSSSAPSPSSVQSPPSDIPTYYALFPETLPDGPPPRGKFHIDVRALRREFLRLQAASHPDFHHHAASSSSSSPAEQEDQSSSSSGYKSEARLRAEEHSALINAAYKTLSSPLLRAQYLLRELHGIDVESEEHRGTGTSTQSHPLGGEETDMDPAEAQELLFTVLEAREAIEEAKTEEDLREVREAGYGGSGAPQFDPGRLVSTTPPNPTDPDRLQQAAPTATLTVRRSLVPVVEMASPGVAAALEQAKNASQANEYQSILSNLQTLSSPDHISTDLKAWADAVLSGNLGVLDTRNLLNELVTTLRKVADDAVTITVAEHVIRALPSAPLSSSLVEQGVALREMAATAHESREDFLLAARLLSEIPLDSSQRRVPDAEKAALWVRIVRDYLEVDDSTSAETYLNKLRGVMHDIPDPEINLHFRLSAARIQDSNRQFLQAAKSYHDISFSPAVAEDDRMHTLSMAIKCAVLAPAGPQRSRALGRLYKDERTAELADEHAMLEKMFFDRLLTPGEVDKFAQGLAPHQLATTADGSTVLARAVVEHNLRAASRIYANIGLDELGKLLGLDGDKAEETTARMIEQGRLAGSIDQIERVVYFENSGDVAGGGGGSGSGEKDGSGGSGHAAVSGSKEMRRWDANVQTVAEDVERLTDALQAEFPEFVAATLVA
ncbi:hypothetical protein VTJ49DRAFT_5132 [Mycothermus thermophilus]|uniref:COP9 signalosome complex subunit 4 n=1 Tax=Humicola insolens TaxID=85995 RepID=A0ABR3V3U3_HUMIN